MAHVLTVDDSITMRQMVRFTLASAGHQVDEAGNADEALERARVRRFDLVVADVNMPGRSGIELVKALRELPGYKFTPILMLTTESDAALKQAGKAAGATGWLVKPFDPDTLISVLRRVLD
ncbi:response regulator [Aromatoleum toluclasticum]|uniref:response regulator n=1 Tax=Aromatoleum toluclasticum TaxID=92003 RepID=UPI0003715CB5|nr:response regulator [Aromatoleum toluclasticum]